MFFKDFLNLCDDDTKIFIKGSLSIDGVLAARVGGFIPNSIIKINDECMDDNNMVFFIFLYMMLIMSDQKELNLNIDWFKNKVDCGIYNIPTRTQEAFDYIKRNYVLIDRLLEYVFSTHQISSYIKAYADNSKRIICMERILYNFIKEEKWNRDYFNVPQEFVESLEKIAIDKENNLNQLRTSGIYNRKYNLQYGNVLTNENFKFDPLIGREKELRMLEAFLMDEEKSVILYGNPGTGKTALVKGLAYDIKNNLVPESIKNKVIVEMSASELISGCKYVGMVEERLLNIINTLISNKDSILFIDEIHTLMGLGQGSNSNNDVSNILKPYLGDGRLKIIGATTTDEYKLIQGNAAFSRRFNNIYLRDLTDDEILNILNITTERFKEYLDISFASNDNKKMLLLNEILNLSKLAIRELNLKKYNPDFSLSLLRLCYNFAKLDGKECVDTEYVIEGINNEDSINSEIKEQFKKRVKELGK